MRIELTLRDRAGDVSDVAIEAAADVPVAAVRACLAAAGLVAPDVALWHGSRVLGDDVTLAASGVRTGSVLGLGTGTRAPRHSAVSLDVVGGPGAGTQYDLLSGRSAIGRAPGCGVVVPGDADVSRVHAVLDVGRDGVTITDAGSTNGTRVEGVALTAPVLLRAGQLVRVGDSFLRITPADATPAVVRDAGGVRLVNRPPRPRQPRAAVEIALPTPPRAGAPQRVQLLAALVPAAAAVAFAWSLHATQFLYFALLSPVLLLTTALGDRLHWRRARRREAAGYRARLRDGQGRLAAGLAAETAQRRAAHPDPAAVADIATLPGTRLWERRRTDPDALQVRLGLADQPSALTVRDGDAVRPAGRCTAVPLAVRLRDGPLGLAGPTAAVRAGGGWLLAQLCTLHSPADVEIVLLLDRGCEQRWRWSRWLPHLRGRVATSVQEWAEVVAELAEVIDARRRSRVPGGTWNGPWTVVFVDAAEARDETPALGPVLAGADAGVTVVWLGSTLAGLPPGCAEVAQVCGEAGSHVRVGRSPGGWVEAVLDQVSAGWCDRVARALAPLADADTDAAAALPPRCRLADVIDVDIGAPTAVEAAWAAADGGAATVLGATTDGPCVLDLVRDGPHALVAGTTGSGKSELLQTLIAGLAARYPPEQLALLLVDYKGGAAFGDCARLPHTAGLVTDLDAALTRRALRSLEAELVRRERLFAQVGAADLDGYRANRTEPPVPRLVLVVDEFAALAEELPDFLRGLVSVAQRGRSLGLHLVLATQRPGSVVSPQIRANASIRIALRVTDGHESAEIVDVPDAAAIDRRCPGRALLRVGPTLTAFQTAHVNALATPAVAEEPAVQRLGPWRMPAGAAAATGRTELPELVAAVRAAVERTGRREAGSPWRDPLPTQLGVDQLPAGDARSLPLGLVDIPSEQRQDVLRLELDHGPSLLLAGSARSGRSTALRTIAIQAARRLPPALLHLHVIDPTGALSALRALPHCGTYAGGQVPGIAAALVDQLGAELERRRQLLAAASAAEARAEGRPIPHTLVLVDGWEAFSAAADERDGGRTSDALLTIARSGPSAGITVVAAGDRAVLSPRVSAAFGERLVGALADRADFGLAGIAARDVPEQLPPGRGVRCRDGAEYQLGFPGSSASRDESHRVVAALAAHPRTVADHPLVAPIVIRPLPLDVRLDELAPVPGQVLLGVGGDAAEPVAVHLTAGSTLLVAGPPRSGRTTVLRSLLAQLDPARTQVAAPARSPLAAEAAAAGATLLGSVDDLIEAGAGPTTVLMDDLERFEDSPLAERLAARVREGADGLIVVASARSDEIATAYRGIGAALRRNRCGLLLRPGPVDGDVLGLRLPRHHEVVPPGRGLLVGDPAWGQRFTTGAPIQLQVARP